MRMHTSSENMKKRDTLITNAAPAFSTLLN